jgi:hypothetical protein
MSHQFPMAHPPIDLVLVLPGGLKQSGMLTRRHADMCYGCIQTQSKHLIMVKCRMLKQNHFPEKFIHQGTYQTASVWHTKKIAL